MADREMECGIVTRIVSRKTGMYTRGIVGIDGWANFAVALKTYADCRQVPASNGPSEDTNQNSVYLMLMGYALEDLAKCIIAHKAYNQKIEDVKDLVQFEENLGEFWFTTNIGRRYKLGIHNLDRLYRAKDISFKVSDTEIEHLKVISIYTQWKGRYPVPLEINKVPSSSEPTFEDLSKTAISIYDQAMAEVEKLRSMRS